MLLAALMCPHLVCCLLVSFAVTCHLLSCQVSESLLVRPDQRSRISRECIISFLMTYSKLGPCLRWSSDADLMRLAGTCFLCEPPAQGKEILAAQETPINTCYIIVRGTMPHFIAGGLNVTRRVGDIIGGTHAGWKASSYWYGGVHYAFECSNISGYQ